MKTVNELQDIITALDQDIDRETATLAAAMDRIESAGRKRTRTEKQMALQIKIATQQQTNDHKDQRITA